MCVLLAACAAGCGGKEGETTRRVKMSSDGARASAESLEVHGQVREAFESYRAASRRYPMEGWVWEGIGRAAQRLGRDDEAAEAFRTALRRDPGRSAAHRDLAALEMERGRFDEALREIDDAIRLAGELPDLLALRARILLGIGHPVEAAAMLARARGESVEDPAVRIAELHAHLAADSLALALAQANELVRAAPNDPRVLEARALVLERSGDTRAAAADLARALDVDPQRPHARRALARLLLASDDAPGAEAQYRRLLADHPSDARALEGLGSAALARGDPESAEKAFREAIDASPEAADPYLALGRFLVGRHRLEEGIDALRKARARAALDAPKWESCSTALAEAHLRLGEASNSLEIAESVLARIPESKEGRAVRARALAADAKGDESGPLLERLATRPDAPSEEVLAYCDWLLERGDASRALAVAEPLAERDSTDVQARVRCGNALAALGRTVEARSAWNAALAHDPLCTDAILGIARSWMESGRFEEAVASARLGESADPSDARFPTIAGEALLREGRLVEADSTLARALATDPRDWRAGLLRGILEDRMGRPREAVARFEAMLQRDERLAPVHAALGWVLADREMDAVRAEHHAQRALELSPTDALANAALAWAVLKQGRVDDALRAADEAKSMLPRDARVAYVRGAVLQAMNQERDARSELRRAMTLDPSFDRADDVQSRLEAMRP